MGVGTPIMKTLSWWTRSLMGMDFLDIYLVPRLEIWSFAPMFSSSLNIQLCWVPKGWVNPMSKPNLLIRRSRALEKKSHITSRVKYWDYSKDCTIKKKVIIQDVENFKYLKGEMVSSMEGFLYYCKWLRKSKLMRIISTNRLFEVLEGFYCTLSDLGPR